MPVSRSLHLSRSLRHAWLYALPGLALCVPVSATPFTFSGGAIETTDQDPGFRTQSRVVAGFPVTGDVTPESDLTFDFAEVFTPETTVQFEPGDDDDLQPLPARVSLNLILPTPTTLVFNGQTVGRRSGILDPGNGVITFDEVRRVTAGGEVFEVRVNDTVYNDLLAITGPGPDGLLGLGGAGTVTVTVSQVIPEPSVASLLVAGTFGIASRRRRTA